MALRPSFVHFMCKLEVHGRTTGLGGKYTKRRQRVPATSSEPARELRRPKKSTIGPVAAYAGTWKPAHHRQHPIVKVSAAGYNAGPMHRVTVALLARRPYRIYFPNKCTTNLQSELVQYQPSPTRAGLVSEVPRCTCKLVLHQSVKTKTHSRPGNHEHCFLLGTRQRDIPRRRTFGGRLVQLSTTCTISVPCESV